MQDIARELSRLLDDDLLACDYNRTFSPCPQVAADSLRASLVKKWLPEGCGKEEVAAAEKEGLSKFLLSNQRCAQLVEFTSDDKVLMQIKAEVQKIWHDICFQGPDLVFDLHAIARGSGLGPGANLGMKSKAFYIKLFASPLSFTSEHLLRCYRAVTYEHPSWSDAERLRNQQFGVKVVAGSKLFHVPKTFLTTRTAATEPTLNMFFQKGIGAVLESRLQKRWKIDLSKQPDRNRSLARRGSRWSSFGTIDLSSASDSISLSLCKELFPAQFMNWLELTRSPTTILPDGTSVRLSMVSSMGNGFTFPLETALFASIVEACYTVASIKLQIGRQAPLNFGVFGDDIIVRKDVYDLTCKALQFFGFVVNDDKSFNTGPFRESCGEDYHLGSNVRGVYLKSLSTNQDVYSAINRLVRWSATHGIMLKKTISYLRSRVMDLPVPYAEGDTAGIKKPFCCVSGDQVVLKGWRTFGYRALTPIQRPLRLPEPRHDEEHLDSASMRIMYSRGRLVQRAVRRLDFESERVFYNPSGLLISFLGGYIRNGGMLIPFENKCPHKVVWKSTNSWDSLDAQSFGTVGDRWQSIAASLLS